MKYFTALRMTWWFLHTLLVAMSDTTFAQPSDLDWQSVPVSLREVIANIEKLPADQDWQRLSVSLREILSDIEKLPADQVMGREENVTAPSGRGIPTHLWWLHDYPAFLGSDVCGSPDDNNWRRWREKLYLGIVADEYSYCGPYETDFSNAQCPVVCNRYGITVNKCERICESTPSCNAFNWSGHPKHGCVLRSCPGNSPPFPTGTNPDFVSFTKKKPRGASACKQSWRPKVVTLERDRYIG